MKIKMWIEIVIDDLDYDSENAIKRSIKATGKPNLKNIRRILERMGEYNFGRKDKIIKFWRKR